MDNFAQILQRLPTDGASTSNSHSGGATLFKVQVNFDIHGKSCSPRIELSNDVSCASNGDSTPKLHPREVETPIYPNGAHSFDASSPRVRFLYV